MTEAGLCSRNCSQRVSGEKGGRDGGETPRGIVDTMWSSCPVVRLHRPHSAPPQSSGCHTSRPRTRCFCRPPANGSCRPEHLQTIIRPLVHVCRPALLHALCISTGNNGSGRIQNVSVRHHQRCARRLVVSHVVPRVRAAGAHAAPLRTHCSGDRPRRDPAAPVARLAYERRGRQTCRWFLC